MRRALALFALAGLAGCGDKPVTYSYFLIDAHLDRTTVPFALLDTVAACGVVAQAPSRQDAADLHCQRHQVKNDLGTFEYTTTLTEGSVTFVLTATDYNQQLVAMGTSAPIAIIPGKTATGSVTAVGVQMTDAGAPEADAGAAEDAAPTGD